MEKWSRRESLKRNGLGTNPTQFGIIQPKFEESTPESHKYNFACGSYNKDSREHGMEH